MVTSREYETTGCLRCKRFGCGVVYLFHFQPNSTLWLDQGTTLPAVEGPSALVRSLRPSYPYSVIPGGVYSLRELEFADGRDTVVRSHYANFDVKNAKLVSLTDDRYQYVSYRLKDQVYWTNKKLRIPKGELLLTDGISYARARCGNRLSDKPGNAVSVNEPSSSMLSLGPVTPVTLPNLALAEPPAFGDIPAGEGVPANDGRDAFCGGSGLACDAKCKAAGKIECGRSDDFRKAAFTYKRKHGYHDDSSRRHQAGFGHTSESTQRHGSTAV